MRSTADTVFVLAEDPDNAHSLTSRNKIEIGLEVMTLETIIHELNETILTDLLFEFFGVEKSTMVFIKNRIFAFTHILSPYGESSLIYPALFFLSKGKYVTVGEENLIDGKVNYLTLDEFIGEK
jgi:hypothetical protein